MQVTSARRPHGSIGSQTVRSRLRATTHGEDATVVFDTTRMERLCDFNMMVILRMQIEALAAPPGS
jgi:hypothetical protein